MSQPLLFQNQPLDIPGQFGKITHSGRGHGPLVIHIQDLHCNYDVQMNISRMLAWLSKHYGLRLVMVEGASQPINVMQLRSFPVQAVKQEVGDYFVRQGKLTGPEYCAAISARPIRLEGIETPELYQANQKSAKYLLSDEAQGYCADLRDLLEACKPKIYHNRLLDFDCSKTAFRQGKLGLPAYCAHLCRTAESVQADLSAFPNLTRYARQASAEFAPGVEAESLYAEMELLDESLRQNLYDQERQKELDQAQARLDLIERLVNLSATTNDLQALRSRPADYSVKALTDFACTWAGEASAGMEADVLNLESYVAAAVDFYRVADQRSLHFVNNLSKRMRGQQAQIAVLITGGYHTQDVLAQLAQRGFAYASITPRAEHQDVLNPYFALLRDKRTPLEKWLAQSQVQLAVESYLPKTAKVEVFPAITDLDTRELVFAQTMELYLSLRAVAHLYFTRGIKTLNVAYDKLMQPYSIHVGGIKLELEKIDIYPRNILAFPVLQQARRLLAVVWGVNVLNQEAIRLESLDQATIGQGSFALVAEEKSSRLKKVLSKKDADLFVGALPSAWKRIRLFWKDLQAHAVLTTTIDAFIPRLPESRLLLRPFMFLFAGLVISSLVPVQERDLQPLTGIYLKDARERDACQVDKIHNLMLENNADFEKGLAAVSEYLASVGVEWHTIRVIWRLLRTSRLGIRLDQKAYSENKDQLSGKIRDLLMEERIWFGYLQARKKSREPVVTLTELYKICSASLSRSEFDEILTKLRDEGKIIPADNEVIPDFEMLSKGYLSKVGLSGDVVSKSELGKKTPEEIFALEMNNKLYVSELVTWFGRKFEGEDDLIYRQVHRKIVDLDQAGQLPDEIKILVLGSALGIQGYDVAMACADAREKTGKSFRVTVVNTDAQWVSVDEGLEGKFPEEYFPPWQRFGKYFRNIGKKRQIAIRTSQISENLHVCFEKTDILAPGDVAHLQENYGAFNIVVMKNVHYAAGASEVLLKTEARAHENILKLLGPSGECVRDLTPGHWLTRDYFPEILKLLQVLMGDQHREGLSSVEKDVFLWASALLFLNRHQSLEILQSKIRESKHNNEAGWNRNLEIILATTILTDWFNPEMQLALAKWTFGQWLQASPGKIMRVLTGDIGRAFLLWDVLSDKSKERINAFFRMHSEKITPDVKRVVGNMSISDIFNSTDELSAVEQRALALPGMLSVLALEAAAWTLGAHHGGWLGALALCLPLMAVAWRLLPFLGLGRKADRAYGREDFLSDAAQLPQSVWEALQSAGFDSDGRLETENLEIRSLSTPAWRLFGFGGRASFYEYQAKTGKHVFYFPANFFSLPLPTRQAVMAHELTHYAAQCHRLLNPSRAGPLGRWASLVSWGREEFRAMRMETRIYGLARLERVFLERYEQEWSDAGRNRTEETRFFEKYAMATEAAITRTRSALARISAASQTPPPETIARLAKLLDRLAVTPEKIPELLEEYSTIAGLAGLRTWPALKSITDIAGISAPFKLAVDFKLLIRVAAAAGPEHAAEALHEMRNLYEECSHEYQNSDPRLDFPLLAAQLETLTALLTILGPLSGIAGLKTLGPIIHVYRSRGQAGALPALFRSLPETYRKLRAEVRDDLNFFFALAVIKSRFQRIYQSAHHGALNPDDIIRRVAEVCAGNKGNPLQALLKEEPAVEHISVNDPGDAPNNALRLIGNLLDMVPALRIRRPDDFPFLPNEAVREELLTLRVADLAGKAGMHGELKFVRALGRGLTFEDQQGDRLIVKWSKAGENTALLAQECLGFVWGAKHNYFRKPPIPIESQKGEYRFILNLEGSPFQKPIRAALEQASQESAAKTGVPLAVDESSICTAYKIEAGLKYDTYLSKAYAPTWGEFRAGILDAAGELGQWARQGVVHTTLGDIFHAPQVFNPREYAMIAGLSKYSLAPYTIGRIAAWKSAVAMPNLGLGGVRDYKYVRSLADMAGQPALAGSQLDFVASEFPWKSANIFLLEYMSRYSLIPTLLAGRWQEENAWAGMDWQQDASLQDLSDLMRQIHQTLAANYLSRSNFKRWQDLTGQMIDWTRYSRQMAFFMSRAYVPHMRPEKGQDQEAAAWIARRIFGLDPSDFSMGEYRQLTWDDENGFVGAITDPDPDQQSIGNVNGPSLLAEMNTAGYYLFGLAIALAALKPPTAWERFKDLYREQVRALGQNLADTYRNILTRLRPHWRIPALLVLLGAGVFVSAPGAVTAEDDRHSYTLLKPSECMRFYHQIISEWTPAQNQYLSTFAAAVERAQPDMSLDLPAGLEMPWPEPEEFFRHGLVRDVADGSLWIVKKTELRPEGRGEMHNDRRREKLTYLLSRGVVELTEIRNVDAAQAKSLDLKGSPEDYYLTRVVTSRNLPGSRPNEEERLQNLALLAVFGIWMRKMDHWLAIIGFANNRPVGVDHDDTNKYADYPATPVGNQRFLAHFVRHAVAETFRFLSRNQTYQRNLIPVIEEVAPVRILRSERTLIDRFRLDAGWIAANGLTPENIARAAALIQSIPAEAIEAKIQAAGYQDPEEARKLKGYIIHNQQTLQADVEGILDFITGRRTDSSIEISQPLSQHRYTRLNPQEQDALQQQSREAAKQNHAGWTGYYDWVLREFAGPQKLLPAKRISDFLRSKALARQDERMRGIIIRDENGVLWKAESQAQDAGKDGRLKRLTFLLAEKITNAAEVRLLSQEEIAGIPGLAPEQTYTAVRLVMPGNIKSEELPVQNLLDSMVKRFVADVFLRRADARIEKTEFTAEGYPVESDYSQALDRIRFPATRQGFQAFFAAYLEKVMLAPLKDMANDPALLNEVHAVENEPDINRRIDAAKRLLKKYGLDQGLANAVGNLHLMAETVAQIKTLDVRALAVEAGYAGEELEEIANYLRSLQSTVARNVMAVVHVFYDFDFILDVEEQLSGDPMDDDPGVSGNYHWLENLAAVLLAGCAAAAGYFLLTAVQADAWVRVAGELMLGLGGFGLAVWGAYLLLAGAAWLAARPVLQGKFGLDPDRKRWAENYFAGEIQVEADPALRGLRFAHTIRQPGSRPKVFLAEWLLASREASPRLHRLNGLLLPIILAHEQSRVMGRRTIRTYADHLTSLRPWMAVIGYLFRDTDFNLVKQSHRDWLFRVQIRTSLNFLEQYWQRMLAVMQTAEAPWPLARVPELWPTLTYILKFHLLEKRSDHTYWLLKFRNPFWGRDVYKYERLAYLLSQHENFAAVAPLSRSKGWLNRMAYAMRLIVGQNGEQDCPQADPGRAFAGLFVGQLFLRMFDPHFANNAFTSQGVPVLVDYGLVLNREAYPATDDGFKTYLAAAYEHKIAQLQAGQIEGFLSVILMLISQAETTENKLLHIKNFMQSTKLGRGLAAAENLSLPDIEKAILHYQSIKNVRALVEAAGFSGKELDEITEYIEQCRNRLGRDVGRAWKLLTGEESGLERLDETSQGRKSRDKGKLDAELASGGSATASDKQPAWKNMLEKFIRPYLAKVKTHSRFSPFLVFIILLAAGSVAAVLTRPEEEQPEYRRLHNGEAAKVLHRVSIDRVWAWMDFTRAFTTGMERAKPARSVDIDGKLEMPELQATKLAPFGLVRGHGKLWVIHQYDPVFEEHDPKRELLAAGLADGVALTAEIRRLSPEQARALKLPGQAEDYYLAELVDPGESLPEQMNNQQQAEALAALFIFKVWLRDPGWGVSSMGLTDRWMATGHDRALDRHRYPGTARGFLRFKVDLVKAAMLDMFRDWSLNDEFQTLCEPVYQAVDAADAAQEANALIRLFGLGAGFKAAHGLTPEILEKVVRKIKAITPEQLETKIRLAGYQDTEEAAAIKKFLLENQANLDADIRDLLDYIRGHENTPANPAAQPSWHAYRPVSPVQKKHILLESGIQPAALRTYLEKYLQRAGNGHELAVADAPDRRYRKSSQAARLEKACLVEDELGHLWEIKAHDPSQGLDGRRERLAYLAARAAANAAEVRWLAQAEIAGIPGLDPGRRYFAVRLVFPGNLSADELTTTRQSEALSRRLAMNIFLRRPASIDSAGFLAAGMPVEQDFSTALDAQAYPAGQKGWERFIHQLKIRLLLEPLEQMVAAGSLPLEIQQLRTVNDRQTQKAHLQALIRKYDLNMAWLNVEQPQENVLQAAARQIQALDVEALAREAGYEGQDLKNIVDYLRSLQVSLKDDIRAAFGALAGDDLSLFPQYGSELFPDADRTATSGPYHWLHNLAAVLAAAGILAGSIYLGQTVELPWLLQAVNIALAGAAGFGLAIWGSHLLLAGAGWLLSRRTLTPDFQTDPERLRTVMNYYNDEAQVRIDPGLRGLRLAHTQASASGQPTVHLAKWLLAAKEASPRLHRLNGLLLPMLLAHEGRRVRGYDTGRVYLAKLWSAAGNIVAEKQEAPADLSGKGRGGIGLDALSTFAGRSLSEQHSPGLDLAQWILAPNRQQGLVPRTLAAGLAPVRWLAYLLAQMHIHTGPGGAKIDPEAALSRLQKISLLAPDALTARTLDPDFFLLRPFSALPAASLRLSRLSLLGTYRLEQGRPVIYIPDRLLEQRAQGSLRQQITRTLLELSVRTQALKYFAAMSWQPQTSATGLGTRLAAFIFRAEALALNLFVSAMGILPAGMRSAGQAFCLRHAPLVYLKVILNRLPPAAWSQEQELRRAYLEFSQRPDQIRAEIWQRAWMDRLQTFAARTQPGSFAWHSLRETAMALPRIWEIVPGMGKAALPGSGVQGKYLDLLHNLGLSQSEKSPPRFRPKPLLSFGSAA